MMKLTPKEPITIIGMHRSGTSLVSSLLSQCDVWMGKDIDGYNYESLCFQNINKSMLRENGDNWFDFCRTLDSLADGKFQKKQVNSVRRLLKRKLLLRHFGLMWMLREVTLPPWSLDHVRWGWKDPRTTLLFPIWKKIYPKLQMIGMVRNPRDVCISLYYRELYRFEGKIRQGKPLAHFEFPLHRCFDLWKEYTQQVLDAKERYHDQVLVVRYEKLKQTNTLSKMMSFLKIDCNLGDLSKMIKDKTGGYPPPPGLDRLNQMIAHDPLVAELNYE